MMLLFRVSVVAIPATKRWCNKSLGKRAYSLSTVLLTKKKNQRPKLKLSHVIPQCITDLTNSSNDFISPSVLVNCADQFGRLPTHERWARFQHFMILMQGCVEKLESPHSPSASEIMKLIECSRFFAVSSSSPELKAYLDPLVSLYTALPPAKQLLNSQDITSLSGGMSSMTNETSSLVPLLGAVIPVLSSWDRRFSSREAYLCLLGLRGLDSDHPLSLEYLQSVAGHIKHADWNIWKMDKLVDSLCGLQRMSDDVPLVKDLFENLCQVYLCYSKPYQSFAIGNALCGLLRKDCTVGVAAAFVNRLVNEISNAAMHPSTTLINLDFLQHRAALIFPMLKINGDVRVRADEALSKVRTSIRALRSMTDINGKPAAESGSQLEDDVVANLKKKIMADGRIKLSTNEFLHGFEADIVFRFLDVTIDAYKKFNIKEMKYITINVEIDGPSHSLGTKEFLDSMRDKYLLERGVITVRLGFNAASPSRITSIGDIMALAIEKYPELAPVLDHFAPSKEDFGNSFKAGKKCRSTKVRFIRGPEDMA